MDIFKLIGTIAVNNSDANKEIDETTGKASNAHDKMTAAFNGIGKAAVGVGKFVAASFATITAGFVALGAKAVSYNAEMEQYQTSFEVMLGSQAESIALMDKLKAAAAETPFEMSDLANTTQLLLNYGLTAEQATERMMMLGDIAQGNADKMTRIATAYGQMSSAGKVSLEDIKQMIETGFNPLQEISETTGESMASLYDRISKGTISIDEITASMQRSTSQGGKYFQSMEKQSQTFEGRLSTLKDTVNEALGTAFESVSEVLTNDVIPTLTQMAEKYIPQMGVVVQQLIPPIMQIAQTFLPVLVSFLDTMIPMFTQFTSTILPLLASAFETILPLLMQVLEAVLPVLFGWLEQLLPIFMQLVEAILPPLISLIEPIITLLQPIIDLLMLIIQPLTQLLNFILPPLTEVIASIATVMGETTKAVMKNWDDMWAKTTAVIEKIVSAVSEKFTAMKDTITEIFETVAGTLEDIWNGIQETFKGAINWILGGIETWINGIIDSINRLLRGLDGIVDSFGDVIGVDIDIPQISKISLPRLARGGILEKGQMGLLEGSGAEAVVPLDQNRAWISAVAEDMNSALGGGRQVQELKEMFAAFVNDLPDMLVEAFTAMRFDVNNREFARLVKAVN